MRYLVAVAVFLAAYSCSATNPCGDFLAGTEIDGGGTSTQQLFYQLQQMSGWGSCDDHTCSGGITTGQCWIERYQKYPSITGASAEIYAYGSAQIGGQTYGEDGLFYKKLAPNDFDVRYNGVTSLTMYYYMKVDSNAHNNAQALEFDMFQFYFINGGSGQTCGGNNQCWRYMMGTQCDTANKLGGGYASWDLWDSLNGTWNNGKTSLDCTGLLDGNWHKIVLYGTIDHTAKTYTFKTLTVDGTTYTIANFVTTPTFSAKQTTNDIPNLGAQFQIDVTTAGNGYHEWFDDVRLCTLTSGCPSE